VLQTCGMWTKIFFAALGLSIAVMAFFSYYSWSWLQSIGQPEAAAEGYAYHAKLAWPTLLITTSILLVLANTVYWVGARLWPLWTTFAYFALFTGIRYFWLGREFFAFQKENGMSDAYFSGQSLLAVLLILGMAAIVFVDQVMIIRLRSRAYPAPLSTVDTDTVE
jgi:hypothetical protein